MPSLARHGLARRQVAEVMVDHLQGLSHVDVTGDGQEIVERTLADGRNFRIVKNYFEPDALMAQLAMRGWRGRVRSSGDFFIFGALRRAAEG